MNRFVWLQSRTQTLIAAAALAIIAVVTAFTGVHLSHLYNSLVVPCETHGNCNLVTSEFLSHDGFLQNALMLLLRLVPAVIGIFWGAPLLARELETGTYRLAWTQSVTRSRWLLSKLGLVGLAAAAVGGLLTLITTWWFRALDTVSANQYGVFDTRDIAPIGYTVFAFMLGTFVGAVIRRTVPAMATTLAVFVFVRVAITLWLRSHLLPAVHATMSLAGARQFGFESSNGSAPILVARGGSLPRNSWQISNQMVTSSGHVATAADRVAFIHQYCPSIAIPPPGGGLQKAPDPSVFRACADQAQHVFHLAVTYQPASHYWPLQWLETGIYVALAAVAGGACYWWITQRAR